MTTEIVHPSDCTGHDDPISTEGAQNRLADTLRRALTDSENTLIEAPTSLGKTHYIATTNWLDYPKITNGEPVIHLHRTTDARDEAANMSEDAGIEYTVLQGREQCSVARGQHDNEFTAPNGEDPSDWFDRKCDKQGYEFSRTHNHLERELGELPCQHDGVCGGTEQWVDVPRNEDNEPEYDIIHATHHFARVPKIVEDTNVIIDERPDYGEDMRQGGYRFQRAVNDYLEHHAPKQRYAWSKLTTAIADRDNGTLAEYCDLLNEINEERLSIDNKETHRLAPSILRAAVSAESQVGNRFSGNDGQTAVVFKDNADIQVVRERPAFGEARCVIGLDAHPSKRLWKQNTSVDLQHERILSEQERKRWRQEERGLRVIQVGSATRSLTTGWWENNQYLKAKGLIRRVRLKHGDSFSTCITVSRVEDDIREAMTKSGIEDLTTMHYGEQHSRNDFKDEEIGLLVGCNDPGDENILDLLAEQGLKAQPEVVDTGSGEERAVGRGFDGPDADAAQEFLESVREENVSQAIGRYARSGDDGAVVYVWTNAIPEHLVDQKTPGTTSEVTDMKLDMLDVVRERTTVTAKIVHEELGVTKEHVRTTFRDMVEQGVLTVSEKTGDYGANEYTINGKDLLPTMDITSPDSQASRL